MRTKCIPKLDESILIRTVIRSPMIVHHPGIKLLCGLNMLTPDLRMGLRAQHGGRKRADFNKRRIKCRTSDAVLCICYIDPPAHRQPVLARSRKLINFGTHHCERNVDVNLTVLDGKRKCELHAFLGFMLRKIYGGPIFAWMRIEGCTFLVYGVEYFNPIHIGLQSHTTNKVHTPRCGRLDTDRGNEGTGFLDYDAHRPARAHLRCVTAFKE